MFDPQIGLALKSMHENVAAPWTVESLAAACGMSQSVFAQKFKDLVSEAPLEYLTNRRMQKAIAILRDKDKKLCGVAKCDFVPAVTSPAFRRCADPQTTCTGDPENVERHRCRCVRQPSA